MGLQTGEGGCGCGGGGGGGSGGAGAGGSAGAVVVSRAKRAAAGAKGAGGRTTQAMGTKSDKPAQAALKRATTHPCSIRPFASDPPKARSNRPHCRCHNKVCAPAGAARPRRALQWQRSRSLATPAMAARAARAAMSAMPVCARRRPCCAAEGGAHRLGWAASGGRPVAGWRFGGRTRGPRIALDRLPAGSAGRPLAALAQAQPICFGARRPDTTASCCYRYCTCS